LERRDRALPVLRDERLLARCEIRIEVTPVRLASHGRHGGADRPVLGRKLGGGRRLWCAGRARAHASPGRQAGRVKASDGGQGTEDYRCYDSAGHGRETRGLLQFWTFTAVFRSAHAAYLLARNAFASRVSGRSVSALFARFTTLP